MLESIFSLSLLDDRTFSPSCKGVLLPLPPRMQFACLFTKNQKKPEELPQHTCAPLTAPVPSAPTCWFLVRMYWLAGLLRPWPNFCPGFKPPPTLGGILPQGSQLVSLYLPLSHHFALYTAARIFSSKCNSHLSFAQNLQWLQWLPISLRVEAKFYLYPQGSI